MAIDLASVFVVLFVSCSGFFVFFIFSKSTQEPTEAAYHLFQIIVGYTPPAWEV